MKKSVLLLTIAFGLGVAFQTPRASAQGPITITACRTIDQPGSYVLANNLFATGDCLVVRANFVTIDLAGFLIIGDGTGAGISSELLGTTVRNGTVVSFDFGIKL